MRLVDLKLQSFELDNPTIMLALLPVLLAFASSATATAVASAFDSPYDFLIPSSGNTVNVKMFQAASAIAPHAAFIKTEAGLPTVPTTKMQIWTFLIEHPQSKRRVLFDLGVRKDIKNIAPAAFKAFASSDGTLPFDVNRDIPEQLVDAGIALKSIDTLIWRSVDGRHCFDRVR
jgi:hypothetical protein